MKILDKDKVKAAISSIPAQKLDIYNLLICAAVKGDTRIVKECLRRNVEHAKDGHAIRLASQKGFLDIVECLVEHGGPIEYAQIYGTKAIKDWATEYNNKEIKLDNMMERTKFSPFK